MARVIIYEFDVAQETRSLSQGERGLHREFKATVLGLASLFRSMARQRAWTRHLREGDACTKYFHLQACHRRQFTEEEAKADIVFSHYNGLLGTAFHR